MKQQDMSASQFGRRAADYLVSPVHASGADLNRLELLAAQRRPLRALDMGCGAGHASFALARGGVEQVTAYDPSPDMLRVVAREAAGRGHEGLRTREGVAEAMPFENESFDLIVTRYSAHHWASVPRALSECARVMAPGGRLIVIDVIAPEAPLFDTSLQVLEFLRDASHVRDYRASEWDAMLETAGFAVPARDVWKLTMEFDSWVARIGTPPARVAALEAVLAGLPLEAREYFDVRAGSFSIDSAWMESGMNG